MPIKIEIFATEFDVIVRNTLREKTYPAESIGHGLHNLSERYKLLGEPPIVIHSENNFFEVRLKLLDK
jgi:two-component system, LytTR family, sensor kinase